MNLAYLLPALISVFSNCTNRRYDCELMFKPPYFYNDIRQTRGRLVPVERGRSINTIWDEDSNIITTTLGAVQGFRMKVASREISAFTGVPYGEQPGRFMDPQPRRPWTGLWRATSPSPYCFQRWIFGITVGGTEDCLYLDIYTPHLPQKNESSSPLLPVIIWLPAGADFFGRSKFWGPGRFLENDVVFVPINTRVGPYGFLSTGDQASSGNWALKDQSLAIEWVHSNIKYFGGDPNKITLGGYSSGGMNSHLMLFSDHKTKHYIRSIIALSGNGMSKIALGNFGRNEDASNYAAKRVGCPTTTGKNLRDSFRMVECLRKVEPARLVGLGLSLPSWKAVVEPPSPTAFLTQLPEVLYAKGLVPNIPLIATRTEHETGLFVGAGRLVLPLVFRSLVLPLLQHSYRNSLRKPTPAEVERNLRTVNSFYFGVNSVDIPPLVTRRGVRGLIQMFDDGTFNAPLWSTIRLHHQLAPTYSYLFKHDTFPWRASRIYYGGSSHISDMMMIFNNTRLLTPNILASKWDGVGARMVNMLCNFAIYGVPYEGVKGNLTQPWTPVTSLENPMVLGIGPNEHFGMIREEWVGSAAQRLWETIAF